MLIRILLFIKMMRICDQWTINHPEPYFEPQHASFVREKREGDKRDETFFSAL
jgi:hypothetical protein